MNLDDYKVIQKGVASVLKEIGFKRKGDSFFMAKDRNQAVINFQKSRSSSSHDILFTINLGVYVSTIAEFLDTVEEYPKVEQCHWKQRIGFLMPVHKDYWWKLDSSTSVEQVIEELNKVINDFALPSLNKHIQEQEIINEWLEGKSEGLTETDRYIYLTTALKVNNMKELASVIKEFEAFSKGKQIESLAKRHIKLLNR